MTNQLAEAHTSLAGVRLNYEWDWSGAEQACKRALELNPNFAWAHSVWSDLSLVMGRHQEAITEAQHAVELDPLSLGLNLKLGQRFFDTGNYDRAFEQLQKALELDPNFVFTHIMLAHVYAWKGMHEESLLTCKKVASLYGDRPYSRALPSVILAIAGKTDEAKKILNEVKGQPKLDALSLISLASTACLLGEKNEAFELLEVAYQERAGFLIFLGIYPTFDSLRSDQRFADLLRRMGLPDYDLRHPNPEATQGRLRERWIALLLTRPRLRHNIPASGHSVPTRWPNHLALPHHREAGRRWDGCGLSRSR